MIDPMEILGYIGTTLDKPGRALRGTLAGDPSQMLNLIPFSDTLGITDVGRDNISGRDMLEKMGVLGRNQDGLDWGDVAGFGVDVLSPSLPIGAGIKGLSKLMGRGATADDIPRLAAGIRDITHSYTPNAEDRLRAAVREFALDDDIGRQASFLQARPSTFAIEEAWDDLYPRAERRAVDVLGRHGLSDSHDMMGHMYDYNRGRGLFHANPYTMDDHEFIDWLQEQGVIPRDEVFARSTARPVTMGADWVPPFYSRLQRAAEGLKGKEFSTSSLLNTLKKAPEGISMEEVQWTGLDKLLASKPRISREELLDYLDKNKLDVKTHRGDAYHGYTPKQHGVHGENYEAVSVGVPTHRGRNLKGLLDDLNVYSPSHFDSHATNLPHVAHYRTMETRLPALTQAQRDAILAESDPIKRQAMFDSISNDVRSLMAFEHQSDIHQGASGITKHGGDAYFDIDEQLQILPKLRELELKQRAVEEELSILNTAMDDSLKDIRMHGYFGPLNNDNPVRPHHLLNPDLRKSLESSQRIPEDLLELVDVHSDLAAQSEAAIRSANELADEIFALRGVKERPYPGLPFKDDYQLLTLKSALRDAAERDIDSLSWLPGEDVQKFTGGAMSGQEHNYGRIPRDLGLALPMEHRLNEEQIGMLRRGMGDSYPGDVEAILAEELDRYNTIGRIGNTATRAMAPWSEYMAAQGISFPRKDQYLKELFGPTLPPDYGALGNTLRKYARRMNWPDQIGVVDIPGSVTGKGFEYRLTPEVKRHILTKGQPLLSLMLGLGGAGALATMNGDRQ